MTKIIIDNTIRVVDIIAISGNAQSLEFKIVDEDGNVINVTGETPTIEFSTVTATGSVANQNEITISLSAANLTLDAGDYDYTITIGDYLISGTLLVVTTKTTSKIVSVTDYTALYFDYRAILERIRKTTSYMARATRNEQGKPLIDEFVMTQDETDFLEDIIPNISNEVAERFEYNMHTLTAPEHYKVQIIGEDEYQIRYLIVPNSNWFDGKIYSFWHKINECILRGLSAEWFNYMGIGERAAIEERKYTRALEDVRSIINRRTTPTKVTYRAF